MGRRIESDIKKGRDPSHTSCTSEEHSSKNPDDDSFPGYYDWPQKWREAYNKAKEEAVLSKKSYLVEAEVHEIGGDTLYILDETEEVFFSTSSFAYGDICKMGPVSNSKVDFDSAITAAYAYKNDYADWDKKHGNLYRAANILSSADTPFSNSLAGTTQECDGCAAYGPIAIDDGDVVLCTNCAK